MPFSTGCRAFLLPAAVRRQAEGHNHAVCSRTLNVSDGAGWRRIVRRALPGMVFCAASSSLPLGMADLPSMSAPTLLVADDHPLFRAAVMHVLRERLPQYAIVEAASAATLGAALQAHPEVELVLLDLAMPGARGFSVLLHVRGEYPEIPVVIISSNDHPRVIRRAQQFGAAGFIPKSTPADTMGAALDAVLAGDNWFPPMVAERSEADAALAARLAQLTPQQFRVLLCLADGLLNKQIAHELGLAENTVKVHVTAILKKLECYSRTQAAVLVKSLENDQEM
jgi:DNA-binding NarL/FixJ family response regulator